jgi:hypothetical protein
VTLLEKLDVPEAVLSRTDLRALGWQRRAVDSIFQECARRDGIVLIPGYSRPMIRVDTYKRVIADSTYRDDRVWP